MTVLTERQHAGEFIVSEANGTLSRDAATLASGNTVKDGDVVALSGGKLVRATGAASSEVQVGVVIGTHDASGGDKLNVPYIARFAEVKRALVYQNGSATANVDADTEAELKTLGIVLR